MISLITTNVVVRSIRAYRGHGEDLAIAAVGLIVIAAAIKQKKAEKKNEKT